VWHDAEQETDYIRQETKHFSQGVKNMNPIAQMPLTEIACPWRIDTVEVFNEM